jgi:hypothetical protein
MTIYDVELDFDVSVNVATKPVFTALSGFTHVLKRPVQFLNVNNSVYTWKSLAEIKLAINEGQTTGNYFVDDVVSDTIIESTSVPVGAGNATLSFTDFTTGDLIQDMYTVDSWAAAVTGSDQLGGARKVVNDSLDSFTEDVYNKLKNNFNIDNGISANEGFGYLATRKVATASVNDPLDPEDADRILALVVYQSETQGSGTPNQASS